MGENLKIYLFYILSIIGLYSGPELLSQADMDSLIYEHSFEMGDLIFNGRYFEARDLLLEIIELKNVYQKNKIESIADSYLNISVVYSSLGQKQNALENLSIAERLYKSCNPEPWKMPNLYGMKSSIYNSLGDYDRAERYLLQSVGNSINDISLKPRLRLSYYRLQMEIFFNKKNIPKFIEYYHITDSILKRTNLPHQHHRQKRAFIYRLLEIDSIKLAKKHLDYVNTELSKVNLDPETNSSWYFLNAAYFRKVKNYDSAFYYYNEAEKIILKNFDESNPYFTAIIENYMDLYFEMGDYINALRYSEQSLSYYSFYNNSENNLDLKSVGLNDLRNAITVLSKNINARFLLSKSEKDPNYLIKAHQNALLLSNIMDVLRWNYMNQSAEYIMDDKNAQYYKQGQMICQELYSFTGEEKYLSDAFDFSEKAKGYNLLSTLRTQTAMSFGGIPEDLIAKESELNLMISGYRELIYTEEQNNPPDKNKLNFWQTELFNTSEEHDKLVKFFEDNYPEYYKLKYDAQVIDIDEVSSRLAKDEVLVEYSILDTTLFIYVISRNEKNLYSHRLNEDFRDKCMEFYNVLTQQSFSSGARKTFADYTRLGYEIYTVLIDPIKEHLEDKNLIIIPDGEISYISFESLLSKEVDQEKLDYYRLPYLILEHGFSTSFSSTIHFNKFPGRKKAKGEILAFAPTYDNISSSSPEEDNVRQGDRDQLIRIPGVKEEVKKISQILDSRVFLDLNATESAFKQNAGDYKFLHLAMHTLLNDATPLYSKLAFTQSIDSLEDGFLHTYEIYNLQLNADLAVLSSCSSGYGNLQEGEGLQSLARGFAYAGCPSILMTLWEVSDNSTVEVMERFYHYLGKGFSKPEALHRSKLDFLQNADQLKSNPFFWSSFVLIGDTEPIYKSRFYQAGINILLLLIPLPVFIILYRRYRKDMRKREII
jgi:CHAT domain-containing protein